MLLSNLAYGLGNVEPASAAHGQAVGVLAVNNTTWCSDLLCLTLPCLASGFRVVDLILVTSTQEPCTTGG